MGLGFKAPTGEHNEYDVYNDNNGLNPTSKPIDQSIEPGDGGWGALLEVQGFTQVSRPFVFGSDQLPAESEGHQQRTVRASRRSVSAGLQLRAGSVRRARGRRRPGVEEHRRFARVSRRGPSRYDVVGRSDGFRRPGQDMYLEPGITFTTGRSTLQLNLPHGVYRYRGPILYTGNQRRRDVPRLGGARQPLVSLWLSQARHAPRRRAPARAATTNNRRRFRVP